jgi:hypothetical protein
MPENPPTTALVRHIPQLATAPPHTAKLLFASDRPEEDHVGGIRINVRITEDFSVGTSRAEQNDPSTIYVTARVDDSAVPEPLPYFPTYAGMSPSQRATYLRWLCDITQPIQIGYVFVYYYGLERHLAFGAFDEAVDEILILRKHHHHPSFNAYSDSALMHGCLIRERIDVLKKLYALPGYNFFDNTNLLLLYLSNAPLNLEVLIQIAETVTYVNRRYLRDAKDLYVAALREVLERGLALQRTP